MDRSVNYGAARRQAFGSYFNPVSTDKTIAAEIIGGTLNLSPHPTWRIPDELSWAEDPFRQRNWVAQLHMLRWLDPVRRVAMKGDMDARDFWMKTVHSWISANKPGLSKSKYAWSNMMDGIRALELCFGLPLVADSADERWLVDAIVQHGNWIEDERHLGHSNHALHQHQGLLVCGLVLQHDRWVELARKRMVNLFEESYDEQGVNAEGSIGYHKNNFIWWDIAFKRFDVEGMERPAIANRLELALEELAYATKPSLQFERIGDIDVGGPQGLRSPEIDFVLSQGSAGTPPDATTKVYDSGYVFGRSGWGQFERDFSDEFFYSLSFGSASRVHGHQDGGALTVHSNGHPWLVDAGKYAYVEDDMRAYCLSRRGHNVIHVDERRYDPDTVVKLERFHLSSDFDEFEFVDNGYEGVQIKRRVIYCRGGDFIVVVDTVRSDIPVTAHQRWLLDPGTDLTRTRWGYSLNRGASSASIQWRGTTPTVRAVRGSVAPFDGWVATGWMKKEATNLITASRQGQHFRMVTVIGASRHAEGVDFSSMVSERPDLLVNVRSGRQHYRVEVAPTGVRIDVGHNLQSAVTRGGRRALPDLQRLVRHELQAAVNAAPRAPAAFTPEYWGKLRTWIRQQDNEREARLMAMEQLLLVQNSFNKQGPDGGYRAAIVDVAGKDLTFDGLISAGALGIRREPMVPWGGTPMKSPTYKMPLVASLADANLHENNGVILVREYGGLTLPIAVSKGDGDILSVRFHGAVDRTKTSLPLFQGLTSERNRGTSHAVFQDPSLDLDSELRLGWYLGRKGINLHEKMAACVEDIQSALGTNHIVLSGSSGGGFAALQVGSFLPNSVVLALNPQTSVHGYHASAAKRAIDVSFDGAKNQGSMLSVLERYAGLAQIPRIVYVQNVMDAHHMENHMIPFKQMLEERRDAAQRVEFIEVDWGVGHKSATPDMYEDFWMKSAARFEGHYA